MIKMKSILLLSFAVCILSTVSVFAQTPVVDSVKIMKKQKEIEKINIKLGEQKEKLVLLESKVNGLTATAEDKEDDAKESASDNEDAAADLNDDIHDKKKARQAKKAAKKVSGDAKDSREATDDLKDLQRDIKSLKKDIAKNEKKLAKLLPVPEKN